MLNILKAIRESLGNGKNNDMSSSENPTTKGTELANTLTSKISGNEHPVPSSEKGMDLKTQVAKHSNLVTIEDPNPRGKVYIDVNGKVVSHEDILKILWNYCHHVPLLPFDQMINNSVQFDDSYINYNLYGSMTGILYRGRYITVCTRNQVYNDELGNRMSDVGLMSGKVGIKFHRATKYISYATSKESWTNLCAFDFTKYVRDKLVTKKGFFNISEDNCVSRFDGTGVYVALGFPEDEQEYVAKSKNKLSLNTTYRSISGDFEEGNYDMMKGKMMIRKDIDFDPNGMQGGSVFAIIRQEKKLVLKFVGIIDSTNKYKNGEISFIRYDAIKDILDSIVDMPDKLE